MRIGNLYVTWRTSQKRRDERLDTLMYLGTDPHARAIVAKMARSEVKNYLAELAEQAGRPFAEPAAFLAKIEDEVRRVIEASDAED